MVLSLPVNAFVRIYNTLHIVLMKTCGVLNLPNNR